MASLTFAAVATALQRFPAFFVTDHAAHSQTYDYKQYRHSDHCSHSKSPFQVINTLQTNTQICRVS